MLKRASLKRRLLLLVLGATLAGWLGEAVTTYQSTRMEVYQLLDAHLEQVARLLVSQVEHELGEMGHDDSSLPMGPLSNVAFQVWEGDTLRLSSGNAPLTPISVKQTGFSLEDFDGKRWRVFSVWSRDHRYLLHVAEVNTMRERVSEVISNNMAFSLMLFFPVLALMLWGAVTHGLSPLVRLTREVGLRDPENLVALDPGKAPNEVLPLIEHLNRLFARIETFLQKERRFTADAAHELRTPVAAIKAQAQVAQAADLLSERMVAIQNVILGCDRAAYLIEQLLVLARIDALEGQGVQPCNLREIASGVVAIVAPAALDQGVRIELIEEDVVTVTGNPDLLSILLRNLIDNAVRHTPRGTTVRVEIARSENAAYLTVSDDGEGIPEHEQEKVMARFYRPSGTKAGGSGLGLSIVKRIADIHGAAIKLRTPESDIGLSVDVIFRL